MAKAQIYVVDATYCMEGAAELLFDVFTVPECIDAMRSHRTMRAAILGDDVVGFIAWEQAINYLYWDLKWLAAGKRRCGIGRLLVDHMKATVTLHDGSHIRVETPEDSEAIRFYESCGFEIVSIHPDFYEAGRGVCTLLWRNPAYRAVLLDVDE